MPEPMGVTVMRPSLFRGVWWGALALFAGWFAYSFMAADGFDEDAFLLLLMVPFFVGWCGWSTWRAWRLGRVGRGSWALSAEALCWVAESGTVSEVRLEDVVALRDRTKPEVDVVGPRGLYTKQIDLFAHSMVTPGSPMVLFDELAQRLRAVGGGEVVVVP